VVPGAKRVFSSQSGPCVLDGQDRLLCRALPNAGTSFELSPLSGMRVVRRSWTWLCGDRNQEHGCWDPITGTRALLGRHDPAYPSAEMAFSMMVQCYVEHRTGGVYCIGNNQLGGLADGTTKQREGFVQARDLPPAKELALSLYRQCALTRQGQVYCWGNPPHPGVKPDTLPKRIEGIDDATSLVAGHRHHCALHKDGTVSCFGACGHGECGNPASRGLHEARRVLAPSK